MINRMIAVADLALNFIFGFLNLPFQVPHWLGFLVLLLIGVAFAFALRAPRWLKLGGLFLAFILAWVFASVERPDGTAAHPFYNAANCPAGSLILIAPIAAGNGGAGFSVGDGANICFIMARSENNAGNGFEVRDSKK